MPEQGRGRREDPEQHDAPGQAAARDRPARGRAAEPARRPRPRRSRPPPGRPSAAGRPGSRARPRRRSGRRRTRRPAGAGARRRGRRRGRSPRAATASSRRRTAGTASTSAPRSTRTVPAPTATAAAEHHERAGDELTERRKRVGDLPRLVRDGALDAEDEHAAGHVQVVRRERAPADPVDLGRQRRDVGHDRRRAALRTGPGTSPGSPGFAPVTVTARRVIGTARPLLSVMVTVVRSGKTDWLRSIRSCRGPLWIVVPSAGFDPTSCAWAPADAASPTEPANRAASAATSRAARRRQEALTRYSTGKSASAPALDSIRTVSPDLTMPCGFS